MAPVVDSSAFFQQLDASPEDGEAAWAKAHEALTFLEEEGLAVDPAFTPGLMVLAGLLPMHFSVRTPKGERIYREITISAPMWSLDITRGHEGAFPDIEFHFRGIGIVRSAIKAMARHYLEAEDEVRRHKGQPVVRRRRSPDFDDE